MEQARYGWTYSCRETPDGHNLLGHPQAEGTARAPEEDRELSIVGAVDFSGETAVADVVMSAPAAKATSAAPTAGEAVLVADETATGPIGTTEPKAPPVKAPPVRPKRKAMPKTSGDTGCGRGRAPVRSTPGRRSQAPGRESGQVKKMPANQGGSSLRSRRRLGRHLVC